MLCDNLERILQHHSFLVVFVSERGKSLSLVGHVVEELDAGEAHLFFGELFVVAAE